MVYKIGITGGIGSGKSKLLSYLSGIPNVATLNLDKQGHVVLERNMIVKRSLVNYFGEEILDKNGSIDR
jgi:dephospho-CoA kinase